MMQLQQVDCRVKKQDRDKAHLAHMLQGSMWIRSCQETDGILGSCLQRIALERCMHVPNRLLGWGALHTEGAAAMQQGCCEDWRHILMAPAS